MATLDLDSNSSQYQIRSFKPGIIQINDKMITSNLIITPNELILDWSPGTIDDLTADSLSPILALKPDIVLIGTGSKLVFLSPDIYGHLINQGIGVEVMNTHSACLTFNALSSENRKVVAALILR
jgi:uncharacterized protein